MLPAAQAIPVNMGATDRFCVNPPRQLLWTALGTPCSVQLSAMIYTRPCTTSVRVRGILMIVQGYPCALVVYIPPSSGLPFTGGFSGD